VKTRDPERIPRILEKVRQYWNTYPDLRFTQLAFGITLKGDPFYVEDEEVEKRLDSFIKGGKGFDKIYM